MLRTVPRLSIFHIETFLGLPAEREVIIAGPTFTRITMLPTVGADSIKVTRYAAEVGGRILGIAAMSNLVPDANKHRQRNRCFPTPSSRRYIR